MNISTLQDIELHRIQRQTTFIFSYSGRNNKKKTPWNIGIKVELKNKVKKDCYYQILWSMVSQTF